MRDFRVLSVANNTVKALRCDVTAVEHTITRTQSFDTAIIIANPSAATCFSCHKASVTRPYVKKNIEIR